MQACNPRHHCLIASLTVSWLNRTHWASSHCFNSSRLEIFSRLNQTSRRCMAAGYRPVWKHEGKISDRNSDSYTIELLLVFSKITKFLGSTLTNFCAAQRRHRGSQVFKVMRKNNQWRCKALRGTGSTVTLGPLLHSPTLHYFSLPLPWPPLPFSALPSPTLEVDPVKSIYGIGLLKTMQSEKRSRTALF